MIDAIVYDNGPIAPGEPAPTLFLDRDGVINARPIGPGPDGYVKAWDEFAFLPGVLDALAGVTGWRVVVVTNQRGVSRGYVPLDTVREVHRRMIEAVDSAGGRIDAVYCCPDHDGPDRKPEPGMLKLAVEDHPGIVAARSVIVGDSATDLLAGRAVGVRGVLVGPRSLRDEQEQRLRSAGTPFDTADDLPAAVDLVRRELS
ncbi:MAG: HAD-IIIA family hydrolase [Planctomycetota bacterium]